MRSIHKILVPTDFSPTARHALDEAVALANAFGASITLLHVYGLPPPMPSAEYAYTPDLVATLDKTARLNLADERDALFARVADAPPIAVKAVLGFPAAEIIAEAEREHADLVVMGTHGRTGFRHLVLGSVAEHVVRQATVPVLTLHLGADVAAAAG